MILHPMLFALTRPLLLLLAVGAFATGCGNGVTSEPSPEVVETAEAVSHDISITAAASTTPVPDEEEEPVTLAGHIFGDGSIGVILAHMRLDDQTAWYPFAQELVDSGDFTVMTFDFRGFGESDGEKQFDRIDTDLEAAYDYMREDLGIDKVFLVGSSMGGTAALVVAPRLDIAGVISISAPGQFPPLDAEMTVENITAPKLFITSEDDVPQARTQEVLWELAPQPKEQHIYPGDAHGTAIFATEHGPDLERRIIEFINEP
jgi:pimeloyl-ACP methyl ester carboxylesterase